MIYRAAAAVILLTRPSLAQTVTASEPPKETTPPASAPAAGSAPTPAAGATTAATVPAPKNVLDEFRKTAFTRTTAGTLDAVTGKNAPETPPKPDAPAPDPVNIALKKLASDVALGNWDAVGIFLREHFKDKPDDAKQAYLYLVTTLGQSAGRSGNVSSGSGGPMPPNQGGMPATFADTNVLTPDDVLGITAQSPADPDPDVLTKLGVLLNSAVSRGSTVEVFLKKLDTGAGKVGGADPAARLRAARLLISAGLAIHAELFLAKPEQALAAKDAATLNLQALAAEGRFKKEGRPEDLERSWKLTQDALSVAEPGGEERTGALRRAVETAPKVRQELGAKWMADSFTTRPEVGMEILAGIGRAAAEGRRNFDAVPREANLELQFRAVQAMLKAAPQRAGEWSQVLTLLALNWMAEAKYSQERDTSSTRGPQMQYDPYGNVFFYDEMMGSQMNQRNDQPKPVAAGRMLDLAPGRDWIAAVDASLRPAMFRQLAELHLKVKAEKDAFPYIETLATTNPVEAKELAERFIEVWGENHDPNADKRRTSRYMYIYGYNPQSDGIPLTRSRQQRNLEELAAWVKKLRALPGGGVDEAKISQAFLRTHSTAEVYRLEDVEMVFGKIEDLKAKTLAGVIGTMRQNLAGLWRAPKIQQEKKTNRTDKEIVAEVIRGYEVARSLIIDALLEYPDDWRLQMIEASLETDVNNYRNEQQKTGQFAERRMAAFALFAKAAGMYKTALPNTELKDQSADVFTSWFYAALGASDLEGVKPEYILAQQQIPLIRAAIESLPGEAAARHTTLFANSLTTRMTAAAPAVKHTYLAAGLEIAGDNERARPARDLLAYYKDLITEIQLQVTVDGPDTVGTQPFGAYVKIRHTKQIEREAGGFQKYLQNQNNQPGFYNFGRPLENYRDKFEETVREALKESFDVLSVTFHPDKVESRGDEEDGWRITPYCYLLLKAKGPQTDALPSLKLSLDFMDTSGYAVLPVVSAKIPMDAAHTAPRPANRIEVQQILDERKAKEGILGLEIKVTARGLVPGLDQLLDLKPAGFTLDEIVEPELHVTQVEAAGDEHPEESAVSERLWNITMRRDPNAEGTTKTFSFAAPKSPEIKTTYFRYADADLKEVAQTVNLEAEYEKPVNKWLVTLGVMGAVAAGGGIFAFSRRKRLPKAMAADGFSLPADITPLSVIGLLKRIRKSGKMPGDFTAELDRALKAVESHYYAPGASAPPPDLVSIARTWLGRVGAR